MNTLLKERIWGSFAGLAVGDALGMPWHELTPEEIDIRSKGNLSNFVEPFADEFIHLGYQAGQITDDTMLTIVTANAILKYGGKPTTNDFVNELAVWVKNNQAIWTQGGVYGPSTKSAFVKFMNNELDGYLDRTRSWISSGTSNGALMRISPAGWANVGNWERASDLACSLVLPTHPTDVALSAAAGLAAGVAEALTDKATVSSIIDAALRGTKHGEIIGKEVARVTANRYPLPNLEYALDLAAKAKDAKEAADLIRTRIGSHFHVSETLATVFGIFYAANGKPEEAILTAVNNGADSDTIASIVGSLCGALYGIKAVPEYWVNTVETINEIKFEQMAEKFVTLNKQK